MKRLLLALTLALSCPWAVAQTTSSQPDPARSPSATEPDSSMRNPSTDGTANYSNGSDDDKQQMKACLAKQQQANPQLSPAEMKRNCARLKPKS
ncbi:MAG: hypothetical protein JO158_06160 [Gammaproteobacteria bacterium]|nr:hypothetical protein [Gammaproteobacteria bacterium]MBV9723775.1 hypothetical protein [Gammaproteobacteria bacterium]